MHPTWTLIIVVVLAVLLFSRPGKLSGFMEDLGKGIRGFRHGLGEGDAKPPAQEPPRQVQDQNATRGETTANGDRAQN